MGRHNFSVEKDIIISDVSSSNKHKTFYVKVFLLVFHQNIARHQENNSPFKNLFMTPTKFSFASGPNQHTKVHQTMLTNLHLKWSSISLKWTPIVESDIVLSLRLSHLLLLIASTLRTGDENKMRIAGIAIALCARTTGPQIQLINAFIVHFSFICAFGMTSSRCGKRNKPVVD